MNINETGIGPFYSILFPHPVLGMSDSLGRPMALVRSKVEGSYISVADMEALADAGRIVIHSIDSEGVKGQYGRAMVTYTVVNPYGE